MKNILNLTQHAGTAEQGVIEPNDKQFVCGNITFNEIPTRSDIAQRAVVLADYAAKHEVTHAMIGGAPFFMTALESALREVGITPLYAFSKRESVDIKQDDGSVKKVAVFKHIGFVEV